MSIQKIMSLTGKKVNQKKIAKSQETTNSIQSQRNDISLEDGNALKNNFLAGISFKGYTEQITHKGEIYGYGTSGALTSGASSICENDVRVDEGTVITDGNCKYDYNSYDLKTASVYYADPGEDVTDEIRNKHMFVVEYVKLKDISNEDIENSSKASNIMKIMDDLGINEKIVRAKDKIKVRELEKENKAVEYANKGVEDANKDVKRAEENLKNATWFLEEAKSKYQEAKIRLEEKTKERDLIAQELTEVKEKMHLAKNKYEEIKAREEKEYMLQEKIKHLQAVKDQIGALHQEKSDKFLEGIEEQINSYIDTLKNNINEH